MLLPKKKPCFDWVRAIRTVDWQTFHPSSARRRFLHSLCSLVLRLRRGAAKSAPQGDIWHGTTFSLSLSLSLTGSDKTYIEISLDILPILNSLWERNKKKTFESNRFLESRQRDICARVCVCGSSTRNLFLTRVVPHTTNDSSRCCNRHITPNKQWIATKTYLLPWEIVSN